MARHLKLPPSFVTKMCNGEKPIPAEHVRAIYAYVGGDVSVQEMRPHDWRKYWPELATQTTTDTAA